MRTQLVVLSGKAAGNTVTLNPGQDNLIGREPDCLLPLNDPACSRLHASIRLDKARWQIADRVSANGTFLNGKRVELAELKDGDKLLIGGTYLRFVSVSETPRPDREALATWVLEDRVTPETSLTSISGPTQELARRRELDCLEKVSQAIAHQTDPVALAAETLAIITDHLGAAGARLYWHEGRTVLAEQGRELPAVADQIVRQAMCSTEAVLVPAAAPALHRRSIFAPLKYMDEVQGVLWVAEAPGQGAFGRADLCLVASIAHVLAPPLKMLLDVRQLQRRNTSLAAASSVQVVGRSPEMQRVLQLILRVANVDHTVLLRGESGVGKEVVARLIHETGTRREQAMVCVNCAALTESLLESELFGHERGAFTGATETRPGKFEMADGGTLFLDELGTLSLATQAKLLRVLDGHPFERVGGRLPIRVNVRVVAATHADLEAMVKDGRFREDLYHRIRVIEIHIAPLRERTEDIADLAEHFLQQFVEQTGRRMAFAAGAIDALRRQRWPGNVRQLRNTIERAAILTTEPAITAAQLEAMTSAERSSGAAVPLEQSARVAIERALRQSGTVPEAARILGMSRSALYRHLKKLDIKPPRARS